MSIIPVPAAVCNARAHPPIETAVRLWYHGRKLHTGGIECETRICPRSRADARGLDGQDQVFVVRAVEKRHKALLTCESLIDEQVFFIVRHGVSEIDGFDSPTVPLELVDYPPTEILVVDRIV